MDDMGSRRKGWFRRRNLVMGVVVVAILGISFCECQRLNVVTVGPDAVVVDGVTYRGPFTVFDYATFADGGSQELVVCDANRKFQFIVVVDFSIDGRTHGRYRNVYAMRHYPRHDFGTPLQGQRLEEMYGLIWTAIARTDETQKENSRAEVREIVFPRRFPEQIDSMSRGY